MRKRKKKEKIKVKKLRWRVIRKLQISGYSMKYGSYKRLDGRKRKRKLKNIKKKVLW